jgi:serine/tyrosine/threonine adenylyltransferase
LTFRRLCDEAWPQPGTAAARELFANPQEYEDWAVRWRQRLQRDPQAAAERSAAMRRVNPAFIPRNHRIEQLIEAAIERADLGPCNALATVLAQPYADNLEFAALAAPPAPGERVLRTFCGT